MVCALKVHSKKVEGTYLDCLILLFHAAVAVLDHFWNEFNDGMDAKAVVYEFVQQQIIPQSVQVNISNESSPKQQNQILHAGLKKSCTEEALMRACDIIIAVKGNPKMRRLGANMKTYLQTGIINGYSYYKYAYMYMFVCVCMHMLVYAMHVCVTLCPRHQSLYNTLFVQELATLLPVLAVARNKNKHLEH